MPDTHANDPALPDDKPAGTTPVRNIDAPDLGGSFEENGQVRRHDGVGAGPGLQPLPAGHLESQREAQAENRESSAGS